MQTGDEFDIFYIREYYEYDKRTSVVRLTGKISCEDVVITNQEFSRTHLIVPPSWRRNGQFKQDFGGTYTIYDIRWSTSSRTMVLCTFAPLYFSSKFGHQQVIWHFYTDIPARNGETTEELNLWTKKWQSLINRDHHLGKIWEEL